MNRAKNKNKKRKKVHPFRFKNTHQNFLIEKLKQEWVVAEKATRRHEVIEKAREAGSFLKETMLGLLLVGGVLTVATVMPGVFVAFDKMRRYKKLFKSDSLKDGLSKNQSKGYWDFKQIDEQTYRVVLTKKGKEAISRFLAKNIKIKQQKQWDGQWYALIFDIPRKYNAVRNALRAKIKQIGMKQLQESVFISPYPCEEEIDFWASFYNASNFIHLIRANDITNNIFSFKDF